MGAASDIEQNTIGRIDRSERRESLAP
jgi:hypothetical protein